LNIAVSALMTVNLCAARVCVCVCIHTLAHHTHNSHPAQLTMSFPQPVSRTTRSRSQLTSTPVNLPSDDEVESKQEAPQCMETVDNEWGGVSL
jgi:hypothetical protein